MADPLWLALGDLQSVEGWLLVCEAGCAIQSTHSWHGALPHVFRALPAVRYKGSFDYAEATESCQPATPDPGAEVGLPRQAGHEEARDIQDAKCQAGYSFPLGDLDLFSTQPQHTGSQANGKKGPLNLEIASLKTLQTKNF